jgi:MAF protein
MTSEPYGPAARAEGLPPKLVLASTSPHRRQLLQRLDLQFVTRDPNVDETPHQGETPQDLARRLARAKAHAVTADFPNALVIGSDQVAVLEGTLIGKPGGPENAVAQLRRASGRTVDFYTAVYLLNTASGRFQATVVPVRVVFRTLHKEQIVRYVAREQAYSCVGSFKSEGLGITLLERMEGEDPTALVGLPLIALTRMLEAEGIQVI